MAIKDKDGTPYRLRGPNPLMNHQQDWDKSKIRYINMGHWKSEVVDGGKENVITIPKAKPEPKAMPVTARQFLEELRAEPEPEPVPEPTKEPEVPVDDELQRLFQTKGIKYFCAPAIGMKTHMDSLYGDAYQTVQYGDKHLFDALVIDQTDLELTFWCIRPITENSIVFRKIREGGERWWRVRSVEEKTGGYLASAIPSDVSPDFS